MRQVRHTAIVAILLVLAGTVMGKTLHVPTADYPTIQAAIDAAASGDKIKVAPGTYAENINFLGKAVRLYSSSGDHANTTIQGTGSTPVVTCANGETSATVLEGFTVTGGNVNEYDYGGGMYNEFSSPTVTNCTFNGNLGDGMCNFFSDPTVANCSFSSNSNDHWGGGMYNEVSSPTVTNCIFTSNSGDGMCNDHGSPTVTNCLFSDNSRDAMLNYTSSPIVTDCTFTGNGYAGMYNGEFSSPTVGGCTFRENSEDGMYNFYFAEVIVTDCTFTDNGGAGMYTAFEGMGTVSRCTFRGNSIGMWNDEYDVVVNDCIFSGNSGPGMQNVQNLATVTNCTFVDNSGGGMYNENEYGSPTVTNCILWSDIGGEIDGSATVTYSDVQGGFAGTGNIHADPLFVDASGGDFHLAPGSPCIDAGTNSPAGGLPATDIEGNRRSIDGDGDRVAVADMGACEASKLRGPRK